MEVSGSALVFPSPGWVFQNAVRAGRSVPDEPDEEPPDFDAALAASVDSSVGSIRFTWPECQVAKKFPVLRLGRWIS